MEAGADDLLISTLRSSKKRKKNLSKKLIKHLLDLHSSPHEKHVTLSSI